MPAEENAGTSQYTFYLDQNAVNSLRTHSIIRRCTDGLIAMEHGIEVNYTLLRLYPVVLNAVHWGTKLPILHVFSPFCHFGDFQIFCFSEWGKGFQHAVWGNIAQIGVFSPFSVFFNIAQWGTLQVYPNTAYFKLQFGFVLLASQNGETTCSLGSREPIRVSVHPWWLCCCISLYDGTFVHCIVQYYRYITVVQQKYIMYHRVIFQCE